MSRPPLPSAVGVAVALGLASGALEVGLRLSPRFGLGMAEIATWYAISMAIGGAFSVAVAVVAWGLGRLAYGAPLGALLLAHAGWAWRSQHINAYLYEPRVWAPLVGMGLGAVLLAWALDRPLARHPRGATSLAALLVVAGGLLGQRGRPAEAPPRADRPNVVLVTLDTARADRFSAYGASNPTPVLDALAAEGALFEAAFSTAPLTQPSHLAILGGGPPHRSGVVSNGTELGPRPTLLPALLRAQGWTTAAFVAGFPLHSRFGWDQAFDVYDDDFGALAGQHRLSLVAAWDQVVLPAHTLRERRGDRVMSRALPWLEAHQDEAFFLWVHLFDAHGPYEAPDHPFDPPTDGPALALPPYWPPGHRAISSADWLVAAYEAEIRYVDAQLGRLIDRLRALGLLDDTVVVVTADHGESLTEHNYLFDHGDHLFDPSLRVPLVVRYPPAARAGLRVGCQVSNQDVAATVLGMVGLALDDPERSRDRGPELRGAPCVEGPVFATTVGARFVETPPIDHALREGGYKLIRSAPRDAGEAPSTALYDLGSDPGELTPIVDGRDPTRPMLQAMERERGLLAPEPAPELDPQTREALQSLGYIE